MKEWDVYVQTKSGTLMTVHMSGYDFESDAVNAAMAQTDAARFISSTYVGDTSRYRKNNESEEKNSGRSYIPFHFTPSEPKQWTQEELLRKKPLIEEIGNFFIAAWIPTLLLMMIHVILGVAFAVGLGIWWFKD